MPINYSNAKIYCIRSHQTDKIYVGSTTRELCQRLAEHRRDFKIKHRNTSSFELLKYDDYYIELIKECPCENVQQLRKIEGKYIRKMNCVNKKVAGRTKKEYNDETYDHRKAYREKHKEKYKQFRNTKIKCKCGVMTTKGNKARHEKSKRHLQTIE